MTNCPPEATLRLIGTEAVGEATFAGLEDHVEQCPECQKILEAEARATPQATLPAPPRDRSPTLPGLVIERELGRGGASVVYLARETALNRHVAVKLFPRSSPVDPRAREHWLREARALSRVPHDRVVAIHRVDETEEWLWLVLEYVSGGTLKERLTEPLPPGDAARLMETIARAVGYFHARGVCHLDLKPSNILLDGEPEAPWDIVSPKVSDFGIARLEDEPGMTETGANGPKGTPSYMAPEQVAALPGTIGPAADLHALGALLYHLLTGRPPFQGASSADTLDQVRNQDPVPPRRLNRRIPRDLETICLTCLEKAPNRRYRSAEALAGDLRLWLDGRPIKARRVTPMGHAWRLCRRHPAVAGLVVALAMTLATGVVGLVVLLNQATQARRHAKAQEKFSASTADKLGTFLRTTIRHQRNTTPDQMTAALLELRNSINDLRSGGIVPSSTIGILEEEIAWGLTIVGKIDQARDLLKQSISDLKQSSEKEPDDKEVRFHFAEALLLSGEVAEFAGEIEDALNCFEQAAAIHTIFEPSYTEYCVLTDLHKRLQGLADRLLQKGRTRQEERARRLSRQILEQLLGVDFARSPDMSHLGLETLGRLFQLGDPKKFSSHDNEKIQEWNLYFVANWLALSVGPLSPFRSSSSAATYDRDPEGGAIALISAIRERCSKLGLAESMVDVTITVIYNDAISEAGRQGNLGQLDEAHATAARLMSFARRLVQENPKNAYYYYILSNAHDQIKKNAMRCLDHDLELKSLVQAVEAGQRAITLDPDRVEIRRHLDKITVQLSIKKAERKAASPSPPAAPGR